MSLSPSARFIAAAVLSLLCFTPALAATAGNGATGSGHAEALLVAQILLLLVVGRLLGEVLQRFGQPALMGQLLAGIILGPSLFGWVWPEAQHAIFASGGTQQAMINGLSQIGILLLLLLTGMETDLRLVKKVRGAAAAISVAGVAVPFLGGFALGQWLPESVLPAAHADRLVPSLFLGTALAISSVKIVAMVVREMNFMRRNLGQMIVASAIIEDTIGWIIIALTFGIAGQGHFDLWSVARTVLGVTLFLVFSFTIGRRMVFTAIRWANDNFRSEFPVITTILVIMGVMALITQALGVHTVLGAFIAGVLIGESPILTDHIQSQLRGLIAAFFMPVFFGMSGLSADLTVILRQPELIALTFLVIAVASIGKFAGAFLGAKLGGLHWREGTALGCAMNARGSTEVVVASIGLSIGALTQNLYTMIVTMAMVTTLAMPPMLRAALLRVPTRDEEKRRIAREELDEKGFLPSLERLLLAVDDSVMGRFTARLAGLVAGAQGMPVTILKVECEDRRAVVAEADGRHDAVTKAVKTGAKASAAMVIADEAEPNPEKVQLLQRVQPPSVTGGPVGERVRDEAAKGYDMLMIGLERSHDAEGIFRPLISEIAQGFTGNIAVFAPHGVTPPAIERGARFLVPVNGSEDSRRAAEVSFAIARATGATVTAIYVLSSEPRSATRAREEAVLKDVARLAERYNVRLRSRIAPSGDASAAILRAARRGHDLIVMGVSARPGDDLFFGTTATRVLMGNMPVLFLASKNMAAVKKPEEQDNSGV